MQVSIRQIPVVQTLFCFWKEGAELPLSLTSPQAINQLRVACHILDV